MEIDCPPVFLDKGKEQVLKILPYYQSDADQHGFPVIFRRPVSPAQAAVESTVGRSLDRSQSVTPPLPVPQDERYACSIVHDREQPNGGTVSAQPGKLSNKTSAYAQTNEFRSVQSCDIDLDAVSEQMTLSSKSSSTATVGQQYSHMISSLPPLTSKDLDDNRENGSTKDGERRSYSSRWYVVVACLLGTTFAAVPVVIVVVITGRIYGPQVTAAHSVLDSQASIPV
nr:hypothetical protein CFP56_43799 [Quercus suber]